MKKSILSLLSICLLSAAFTQTIPNGGFENWQVVNYENPTGYFTSNMSEKGTVVNAVKTTDSYHGSYAIRLNTVMSGSDTAFAYFANGDPGKNPAKGGIPYTQQATGIRLYYKSTIMPGDSALVLVIFKKAGATLGQYMYTIGAAQSSYTLFSKTFNPALPSTPDTVVFAAASSNAFAIKGKIGNMLQLDIITFTGVTQQPANLNGDLESWQPQSTSVLNGWITESANPSVDFRTSDAYSGTYALELQTNAPDFGGGDINPGFATTGTPTQTSTVGGLPYTQQIDTMFFYYKYLPADMADSARFYMMFRKNGSVFSSSQVLLGFSATYKKVTIPYNLGQQPDSMIISIESSKKWPAPANYVGSDLKIDNMYLGSQRLPVSKFSMPATGCTGQLIQLVDLSENIASNGAWQWIMGNGVPTNSTLENPTVKYNNPGTFTVTMVASNGFGSGTPVSQQITIYSPPSVAASSATLCSGAQATLTASGALTYTWSNGMTTYSITASPTTTTSFTVTGTSVNNCTATTVATVTVPVSPVPQICMVTVDTFSLHNIVYWDKSIYSNVDSFIVYREITSNIYKVIGAVPYSSLSRFMDTVATKYFPNTGDPNAGTYRYKLQALDTCGSYSALSPYHNTIYATQTNGTFNWNPYTIEGQPTPVPTLNSYVLMRDDNNTGNWNAINSVAGSQTNMSDPAYASFPNCNWRIETSWAITCTPTIIKNPDIMGPINTSRSNIKSLRVTTGVSDTYGMENSVKVYPNPSNGEFTIEYAPGKNKSVISIYDLLGQEVYSEIAERQTTPSLRTMNLNMKSLNKGVYTLCIEVDSVKVFRKITVE